MVDFFNRYVRDQKYCIHQALKNIEKAEKYLQTFPVHVTTDITKENEQPILEYALENGKSINKSILLKAMKSNYQQYDIVWNQTEYTLRARQYPDNKSPLQECSLANIGPTRLKILEYLLAHPGFALGIENLINIDRAFELIEPNTLAQSIRLLRRMLQPEIKHNLYILKKRIYNLAVSRTGWAYIANPNRTYLIVKMIP